MIRQTVLPFKLERTDETLTAHGGLALLAEYNHGLGLRALADHHLPGPGSPRDYAPSVMVDTLVLLLQAGGRLWRTYGTSSGKPRSWRYSATRSSQTPTR